MTNQNILKTFIATLFVGILAIGCFERSYLEQADPTLTCMSNNFFMAEKQTPVPLDGKMYYVCCQGCKDTLTNYKQDRVATDPVSGNKIDKSESVIGKKKNGELLYFENVENMKAWKPEEKK